MPDLAVEPPRRTRRWRRIGLYAIATVLALLIAAEMFCRFYVGLGDPPLSMADPQVEYLFKPNQSCRRYGNSIRYNAYSMRSDDFPVHKSSPDEFRVMMIGDSILNGGSQTDQSELMSTLVQQRLSADMHRPVIVGNISAGSWGPPNELAYLKRFGLFDADVLLIVLNILDVDDVPTFQPIVGISPDYPDRKPWFALSEVVGRLPIYSSASSSPSSTTASREENIKKSMAALQEMIRFGQEHGARVIVLQHPTADELGVPEQPDHATIAAAIRAAGIEPINTAPWIRVTIQKGTPCYRDFMHFNAAGQRVMADVVTTAILEQRPTTRP